MVKTARKFKFNIVIIIMILNTGWKNWDKFLSRFVGKKINCLDIGSYEGDSTCWMLNNLCTHLQSRVYSVDTWEGGVGYTDNTVFSEIEKKFDYNVEKTGRQNQNVKLKMLSSDALIKFRHENNIFFDFIFIDASHVAKDVISDAILAWGLLAENGVMIFDDYKWEKINKNYFNPKIAIDCFVNIFSSELETLYIGYQYFIKKKYLKDFEKPKLKKLYKLIDDINFFKFEKINLDFNDSVFKKINNEQLEFNLTINTKKPNYLIDQVKDYLNYYKHLDEKYAKNIINDFYYFLENNNSIKTIQQLIKNNIKTDKNQFISLHNYPYLITDNTQSYVILDLVKKYFEKNTIENIDIFFLIRKKNTIKNILIEQINKNYNIKTSLKIYSIFDENILIKNFNDVENIIQKQNNKKYNILVLKSLIPMKIGIRNMIYKKNLNIEQFYRIYLCLSLQKEKGFANLNITLDFTKNVIEFIYLLRKYYKNVNITTIFLDNISGISVSVECYDFIGITEHELQQLKQIGLEISNNNNNYLENNNYLHSLLIINKKYYDLIETKLKNYLFKKIDCYLKYLKLLENIYNYIDNHKNDINLLENTIFKKIIFDFILILNSI